MILAVLLALSVSPSAAERKSKSLRSPSTGQVPGLPTSPSKLAPRRATLASVPGDTTEVYRAPIVYIGALRLDHVDFPRLAPSWGVTRPVARLVADKGTIAVTGNFAVDRTVRDC